MPTGPGDSAPALTTQAPVEGMDVITTHTNADFDALGSMIAAKKLYPEAVLVFPGSQEKSLRRFFVQSVLYSIDVERASKIDLSSVTRLILVDIRQRGRIGRFDALVGKDSVEIHIYDHHPPTELDIKGHLEVCRPVGATVTLMVELLRAKGLAISKEEATVMMLGIYEDTGSLTFPSTTVADYQAASYLLQCGADLNAVSSLITSELTMDQVCLLNELIQSRRTYSFHGIEVSIAEASADGYIGDLAVLVHKIKDMENLDVLFALARMENRVFLVGRSRIPEVDAGEVARAFGGGGHPTAASATIKDLTLFQVRERLLEVLEERTRPKKTARDLMSFPVISVSGGTPLDEAHEVLTRYNINALPVVDDGVPVGIITRQVVEKACFHGLGSSPVSGLMTAEFESVGPEEGLETLQKLVVGGNQRLVPVVDRAAGLLGVVTRTDVMKALVPHGVSGRVDVADEESTLKSSREKRLTRLMKERIPGRVFELIQELGRVAESLGMNAYVVGGFVRDLLMRRENLDVDIVTEGDAIAFAEEVARRHGCRMRSHSRFGTAQLVFADGFRVDAATARLEYYERPAALPNVEQSSLKLDLYRRDFTINALAIRITPHGFGELVDFFGGQKDIKDKTIRVIHALSFIEDPTRMFRAVRFAERFGFQLGKQTQMLMLHAVKIGIAHQLEGKRIFGELKLILEEEHAARILRRLDDMGLLTCIHPSLKLDERLAALLGRVQEVCSWFRFLYLDIPYEAWLVSLLGLTAFLADEELLGLVKSWGVNTKRILERIETRIEAEKTLKYLAGVQSQPKPSEIYRLLRHFPVEVLLYMMAKTTRESTRKTISLYLARLREVRPVLRGSDLEAMGYTPGPLFKKILTGLLDARLDGEVTDRRSEMEWVLTTYPPAREVS